jgi:hypothetical protein
VGFKTFAACIARRTFLFLLFAEREYAYDRDSKVGKLDKALDEATAKGWAVVDMKRDWKTVFPEKH